MRAAASSWTPKLPEPQTKLTWGDTDVVTGAGDKNNLYFPGKQFYNL